MNNVYKVCVFILVFMFFGNQAGIANSFFVHIDKPLYTTGETVWFKVYYPTAIEKVAVKVLLVDSEGQVVQDFFQTTSKSNNLSGHLYIPYNYRSGMYRLVFNTTVKTQEAVQAVGRTPAYVKDVQNEVTLAEIAFPIYNDLYMTSKEPIESQSISTGTNTANSELNLNVKTDINQSEFKVRQKVDLEINVTDASNSSVFSDISISVIPKNIRTSEELGLQYFSQGDKFETANMNTLSEEIFLRGFVYNTREKPVKLNVIGAYTDKLNTMYYTKSAPDGAFTLSIPNYYDNQRVQFLSYDKEIEDFIIKTVPHQVAQKELAPLVYNDNIEQYLEQSRKRKKLVQHFDYLESNINLSASANEADDTKSDITFVVDEYEKFPEVYDFFSELITPLQFKKVKGKIIAEMNNPKSSRAVLSVLPGSPLFIVDGKATRNADYAGRLEMSNIKTIELIYSPQQLRKQFNVLGSSGVVRITTLTPIFDMPESEIGNFAEINGLTQEGTFSVFDPKSNASNLPHFYSTIYWNPEVTTDQNGKAKVSFHQTDDVGEYSIIIVAHDKNGNRGVNVIDYTVK